MADNPRTLGKCLYDSLSGTAITNLKFSFDANFKVEKGCWLFAFICSTLAMLMVIYNQVRVSLADPVSPLSLEGFFISVGALG